MRTQLTVETFDVPPRPLEPGTDAPPPPEGWTWPPTSVTLIQGSEECVLVDTVPTARDSTTLADWIEATGRQLTTIYVTHGHVDHYLGAAPLLQRFPSARLLATAPTIRDIESEADSGADRATYSAMFVDEVVAEVVVPELLEGNRLELEDEDLLVVATGQSDHADSSYVHLPALDTVIVGDIAYNDVHCALMETDHQRRLRWVDTLREIQALDPQVVIASHRRLGGPDDARALSDTITYIEHADRLLETNPNAAEFVQQMLGSFPSRLNASTVMFGAAFLGLRPESQTS